MVDSVNSRQRAKETRLFVENAFQLARSLEIQSLLVQADRRRDIALVEKCRKAERVIWVTRASEKNDKKAVEGDLRVSVPATPMARLSQVNLGLFVAVVKGYIDLDESVLCLSGVAGSKRLDTLTITHARHDFQWFRRHDLKRVQNLFAADLLMRVLDISLRLASEGREGKSIGTIFVIGDLEELSPYLRQMILNPCAGHPRRSRNLHNPDFLETIRELAALDGAFIVSGRGVVEAAGTYLNAPSGKIQVRSGLGARHTAAAAITAHSAAASVVLSQSSGTITVYHGGEAILDFEKPRPTTGHS